MSEALAAHAGGCRASSAARRRRAASVDRRRPRWSRSSARRRVGGPPRPGSRWRWRARFALRARGAVGEACGRIDRRHAGRGPGSARRARAWPARDRQRPARLARRLPRRARRDDVAGRAAAMSAELGRVAAFARRARGDRLAVRAHGGARPRAGVARRDRRRPRAGRAAGRARARAGEPSRARPPGRRDGAAAHACPARSPSRAAGRRRRRCARSPSSRSSWTARCVSPPHAVDPQGERGQALLLLVAAMCAALVAALVLGGIARGIGREGPRPAGGGPRGARRRAGDARELRPAVRAGCDRRRAEPAASRAQRRISPPRATRALATARLNGAERVEVAFPDGDAFAPTRIRVTVRDPAVVEIAGRRRSAPVTRRRRGAARARRGRRRTPPGRGSTAGRSPTGRASRCARTSRSRSTGMAAAAARDGVSLIVVSGFRSNAEQARLFAAHPDPRWVAPPGRSLHRLGTELDLGPAARTAGWPRTRRPSTSCSATAGSPGTTASR